VRSWPFQRRCGQFGILNGASYFSVFGSPAGTSGSGGSFTVRDTTNGSGTIIMFTRTLAGNTDVAFEVYDPARAVLVGLDVGDRWPEERESGMSIAGKSIRFRKRRAKQTGDEVAAPRGAARKSRKDYRRMGRFVRGCLREAQSTPIKCRPATASRQLFFSLFISLYITSLNV